MHACLGKYETGKQQKHVDVELLRWKLWQMLRKMGCGIRREMEPLIRVVEFVHTWVQSGVIVKLINQITNRYQWHEVSIFEIYMRLQTQPQMRRQIEQGGQNRWKT